MRLTYESRSQAPAFRRACSAPTSLTGTVHDNRSLQGSDYGKVLFTSACNEQEVRRLPMHRRQMLSVSGDALVTPYALFKEGARDRLLSCLPTIPETDVLYTSDTKSTTSTALGKVRVQYDRFDHCVCNKRSTRCNDTHARDSFVSDIPDQADKTEYTNWLGAQNQVRKTPLQSLPSGNFSAHASAALVSRRTPSRTNKSVRTGAQPGVVRVVGFDLPSAP